MSCSAGASRAFAVAFRRTSAAALRARADEHEWSRPSHDPRRAAKAHRSRPYRDLVQRISSFLSRQPRSPSVRVLVSHRSGQRKATLAKTKTDSSTSPSAPGKTANGTTAGAATERLAGQMGLVLKSAANMTALSRHV